MSEAPPDDRRLRWLFFGLALLYLLPFWTVHYLPTADGPCHVYNAWVLRHYGNVQEYPLFQQHYEINAKPYPNWISQAAMVVLMVAAVPPLIAEKVVVSLYALLFLSGAWYLAGAVESDRRWLAFLAFPFVYNNMFQFGFYNFSFSLALFLFILGFWWRRRDRVDLRYSVGMNLLLWLCYFSHLLSFLFALLAIGILWLTTLRRESWRRHLLHIPALAPQILLPLWFFDAQGSGSQPSDWSFSFMVRYLGELQVLFTFDLLQMRLAAILGGLFLVLVLLTLWQRIWQRPILRESDGFLLAALVFAVVYFLGPEVMSGGSMVKGRLSLYPVLVLLPWLSPGLRGRVRGVFVSGLALAALLNVGHLVHWYRLLEGEMVRYLSGLEPVQPGTRILPLQFGQDFRAIKENALRHAASYAALEKGLIDWDNYEATMTYFSTRFRKSAPPPDIWQIEGTPEKVVPGQWRQRADYIYVWRMPADLPLARRLPRSYRLVLDTGDGQLWERRGRGQAQ